MSARETELSALQGLEIERVALSGELPPGGEDQIDVSHCRERRFEREVLESMV